MILIHLLVFALAIAVGIFLLRALVDLAPFPSPAFRQAVLLILVIILAVFALGFTGLGADLGVTSWR